MYEGRSRYIEGDAKQEHGRKTLIWQNLKVTCSMNIFNGGQKLSSMLRNDKTN